MGSTTDLARWFQPGDLPTFSTARDGTLQLVSNNNSGDEVQLRRDGTLTYVNGGDSPAIFSVSMHCPSSESWFLFRHTRGAVRSRPALLHLRERAWNMLLGELQHAQAKN